MREVYRRDGGRCTYVGTHGHRCRARAFLEFDHVDLVAHGGKSTADKLRLRCRAHNQLTAREVFGDQHMSLHASGFRPVGKPLVPARAREAFEIWDHFLAPPGESSLLAAIRRRRAESTSDRRPTDDQQPGADVGTDDPRTIAR
jgi:hypothetical protein